MNLCRVCDCEISIRHGTPCGHSFCYLCIKRHLSGHDTCPVCGRRPLSMKDLVGLRSSAKKWDSRIRMGEDPKILRVLYRLKRYIKEDRESG
ncbi:zinc finger domain-containing protein [Encephalitozoon romaleae SJ-2008]|uniref:Zinc finger domain-containing protein n=1 Tax=Encephalitozoon romaleae (strain SJ-2008) TaxID=1178016 RepID=I6ZKC1_ENCRO|nr:zinc finger domain-containing protein [Encephalitozoon romaleae SJ-2008]AFN83718.1 zinc finger domain-containing protein [Encephalitozoon romaleae SJ-2008]